MSTLDVHAERTLAIEGGPALARESDWPRWPIHDAGTLAALGAVLESGRWSVSGAWTGRITREQEFGRAWAACTKSTGKSAITAS